MDIPRHSDLLVFENNPFAFE